MSGGDYMAREDAQCGGLRSHSETRGAVDIKSRVASIQAIGLVYRMVQATKLTGKGKVASPEALLAAQQAALKKSVARGRAQYRARETISGDAVSRWLHSWGTNNELLPPKRKKRAG